jgi:hypothetical protein
LPIGFDRFHRLAGFSVIVSLRSQGNRRYRSLGSILSEGYRPAWFSNSKARAMRCRWRRILPISRFADATVWRPRKSFAFLWRRCRSNLTSLRRGSQTLPFPLGQSTRSGCTGQVSGHESCGVWQL